MAIQRVVVNRHHPHRYPDAPIRRLFDPLLCLFLPEQEEEPVGWEALAALAEKLAFSPQPVEAPVRWESEEGGYALHLRCPRLGKNEPLNLGRKGDDLILTVGLLRRTIPLPPFLASRKIVEAKAHRHGITIRFR